VLVLPLRRRQAPLQRLHLGLQLLDQAALGWRRLGGLEDGEEGVGVAGGERAV